MENRSHKHFCSPFLQDQKDSLGSYMCKGRPFKYYIPKPHNKPFQSDDIFTQIEWRMVSLTKCHLIGILLVTDLFKREDCKDRFAWYKIAAWAEIGVAGIWIQFQGNEVV